MLEVSSVRKSYLRYAISSILFVVSGVMQTICVQALLYQGGGDRDTFLVALPNYAGNVMVFFVGEPLLNFLRNFASDSKEFKTGKTVTRKTMFHPERRKLFILAANELFGFALGLYGLALAGSGVYQVVLSGTTVFTALLSSLFLRRRLSVLQWLCVATISFGLILAVEQFNVTMESARSVINGMILTLVSCLFYSSNSVIADYLLSSTSTELQLPPPTGAELSLYTHGTCLMLFSAYVSYHTLPQWSDLVLESIARHHGRKPVIVALYSSLTLSSFIHAVTYYDLIATLGAVAVGIMNSIRAVSVFAASAVFFCTEQASQCYSPRKALVTAIVTAGAIGYSLASRSPSMS